MTTNVATTEVVKRDALGRARMSLERREATLDEFEMNGVAVLWFGLARRGR